MYDYTKFDPENCEFVAIGSLEEFSNVDRLFVEIDSVPIIVFQIAGEIFAIGDVCTHDDGPLGDGEVDGCEVICPRHGARFDVRTGKATSLPAVVDIPAYPTRVIDDQIEVGIPIDTI
jgi:3-phenylpropionate/trans-cinnamate dioxygenase ferredoxin subunit